MKITKIQSDHLQALQQQTDIKSKGAADDTFQAILTQQMEGGKEVAAAPAAGSVAPVRETMPLTVVQPVEEDADMADVARSLDGLLGNLDEYAAALAAPLGADLRKAHSLLQGMADEVAALRQSAPDLSSRHGGMASLLDEISVITRVETVKLNRGDYF